MLGASTVAHTSRGSPSITALPPDEGVVLADVDSVREGRSYSQDHGSGHASSPSDDTRMAPMSDSVLPTDTTFATTALRDISPNIHLECILITRTLIVAASRRTARRLTCMT